MEARYKDFPPGWGHLKIPVSSREAALAGLALYAPCKPIGVWAQRLAWLTTRLVGPALLPGRAQAWTPPMPADEWDGLRLQWSDRLGAFDKMAVYQRLQAVRPGMSLLLIDGREPRAFVKVDRFGSQGLDRERRAIECVTRFGPRSFSTPEALCSGAHANWQYLAVRPLPAQRHRVPRRPPLDAIAADIQSALSTLERPPGTPDHWTPMHGDLTPWNLRQLRSGDLVLLDWEDVGFSPPGADVVLYRASASALTRVPAPQSDSTEAIDFWEDRVRERACSNPRDTKLAQSLLATLHGMKTA